MYIDDNNTPNFQKKTSEKRIKMIENRIEENRMQVDKKSSASKYLVIFVCAFLATIFFVSAVIKKFSPNDLKIDDDSAYDLVSKADMEDDFGYADLDQRLKWIQSEDNETDSEINDELFSMSKSTDEEKQEKVKEGKLLTEEIKDKKEDKKSEMVELPVKKEETAIKKQKEIFNDNEVIGIKPPRPDLKEISQALQPSNPNLAGDSSIVKVYVGYFNSQEEATSVQNKIAISSPEFSPVVKNLNGQYIVQVASFSNRERAQQLRLRLLDEGYQAKLLNQ